ncbi:MAG: hypothetical protein ACK5NE_08185 [Brachymonas sp.]
MEVNESWTGNLLPGTDGTSPTTAQRDKSFSLKKICHYADLFTKEDSMALNPLASSYFFS